jgi:DNA mismatch repair ATPase MutS
LSLLDVLCAFAVRVMSSKGAYVRPVFGDDESPLAVEAGRYSSFYLFSPCWKLLD